MRSITHFDVVNPKNPCRPLYRNSRINTHVTVWIFCFFPYFPETLSFFHIHLFVPLLLSYQGYLSCKSQGYWMSGRSVPLTLLLKLTLLAVYWHCASVSWFLKWEYNVYQWTRCFEAHFIAMKFQSICIQYYFLYFCALLCIASCNLWKGKCFPFLFHRLFLVSFTFCIQQSTYTLAQSLPSLAASCRAVL